MTAGSGKKGGIERGADGKKIGIFMLHGGSGDYKSMEPFARLFAEKFGCKVVSMSFPGRHYLEDLQETGQTLSLYHRFSL